MVIEGILTFNLILVGLVVNDPRKPSPLASAAAGFSIGTGAMAAVSKARFPLPELTARVNGPSWRVTGFHYPSTRAVLTGARFH